MNDDRSFQRAVRDWLDDGSDRTPRSTIDAVLLAVRTTPQQRDLPVPWRNFQMSNPFRLAAAVIAVVAVGLVALNLPRITGIGGPTTAPPTPSQAPHGTPSAAPSARLSQAPTASPAPTSRVSGSVQIGAGPVPADAMTTTTLFNPAFTFTAGSGWNLDAEGPTRAWFSHNGRSGFMIVQPAQVIEVGGSVAKAPTDLVAWLQARADLQLAAPTAITLGGFDGTLLEGSVRPGAFVNGGAAINIACSAERPCNFEYGDEFGVGRNDHFQFVVVSVRGSTLLLGIATGDGFWDDERPTLEAFLHSIEFPDPSR